MNPRHWLGQFICQQVELTTIFAVMLTRSATRLLSTQTRAFSTSSARQTKVAVLGAGGGIGQPLSLLLKVDPLVSSLSLYDIRGAPGVAADVSHIDTNSTVCGLIANYSRLNLRLCPCTRLKATQPTSLTKLLKEPRLSSFLLVSPERCVFVNMSMLLVSLTTLQPGVSSLSLKVI